MDIFLASDAIQSRTNVLNIFLRMPRPLANFVLIGDHAFRNDGDVVHDDSQPTG